MKVLGAEERRYARDAVKTLYLLKLIDVFIYQALIEKIDENTGT